ncbi:MAG TPA: serine hydrolase domain-containing protein [Caulobacter sp.]|nr:serine hydrolase domain-containing protein [Caulobacter sp.]
MRLPSLVLAALACLSLAAEAPDPGREAQALLTAAAGASPGAVVLIARGETVVYRGAAGQAQLELGVPMTADQVFSVASVTKMFTAAAVLKLRDAGKLSLDDPLAAYLPDFPAAAGITLRQLLHHSSGVSDRIAAPTPGFSRRELDTATLVGEIAKRPADFPPGTRWAYSNAGYILLGAVIEKATGKPWHVAVHDEVIAPVGLTHTVYGAAGPLVPGRAAGYSGDPAGGWRNAAYISLSAPAAAGGFLSTADDLRRWIRALATGRLLKPQSVREMMAPGPELPGVAPGGRYGLGLYLWTVRGAPMIGHTGQINGFASIVGYLPDQDLTVVALFNSDAADARTAGRRLAAIALGQPYPQPVAVRPSAADLAALAGAYGEGETARTLFAKDGLLYAQRAGRDPNPLQLTPEGRLHFVPDELSYFLPVRDAGGRVTRLDYYPGGDGPPQALARRP